MAAPQGNGYFKVIMLTSSVTSTGSFLGMSSLMTTSSKELPVPATTPVNQQNNNEANGGPIHAEASPKTPEAPIDVSRITLDEEQIEAKRHEIEEKRKHLEEMKRQIELKRQELEKYYSQNDLLIALGKSMNSHDKIRTLAWIPLYLKRIMVKSWKKEVQFQIEASFN